MIRHYVDHFGKSVIWANISFLTILCDGNYFWKRADLPVKSKNFGAIVILVSSLAKMLVEFDACHFAHAFYFDAPSLHLPFENTQETY